MVKRLNYFKEHSNISSSTQLQELLKYEIASEYCPYRYDSSRITLLQCISKLLIKEGEYKKAVYNIEKAISLISGKPPKSTINPADQIRNYYILAGIYDSLKMTSEKMRAYDSCIIAATRLKIVNVYFLYALLEEVKYQNNIGDYNLCIRQADLGEIYSHQYVPEKGMEKYGDSTKYLLDFAVEKVNALMALLKADDTEALIKSKIKVCRTKSTKAYLGVFNELLGLVKMQQENYKEALKFFKRAGWHYNDQSDRMSYKDNLHNIGFLYEVIQKNDQQALVLYKQALKIKVDGANRKLDSINSLNIYSNIGDLFARRNEFDSAHHYFRNAFNLIKKGTDEKEILLSSLDDFTRSQKVEYLTGLFINKGNAFYRQYLHDGDQVFVDRAISMFKLTDRLFEKIKANQVEIQSKLFWRKLTHPFYEQAIEACIKAGKSDDAFYFFERSRAILLFDQMNEQRGLSEADILEQQKLKNYISELQQQLTITSPDSRDFRRLQDQIFDDKNKLARLIGQIKSRSPLYFRNFLDSTFISLNETRQRILTDRSLVEIFNGDNWVYSMIVTSKEIRFNRINKLDYESTLNQCLSYMSDPSLTGYKSQFNSFVKRSHHLFRLIFNDKSIPEGPVMFSAEGNHFPFETLVTSFGSNGPVYLLEEHSVSYIHSARYLMNQFTRDALSRPGSFLGIAPVRFPLKERLAVLRKSDDAIRSIVPLFPISDTLLLEKATKKSFLHKLGKYQIIQIFTHSSNLGDSLRVEPVIYFADQPLYLSELNNIEPNATQLIILSACNTGNGEYYRGEGVFSFNRAFAALGIPSCINNLWSIDNESTYKLMKLISINISKELPIDEAVRMAKLEFIKTSTKRKQMPYYWAATILSGRSGAIPLKNLNNHFPLNMAAVVAVIVIASLSVLGIQKLMSRRPAKNVRNKDNWLQL